MTIICAVSADFVNPYGEIFSVGGKEIGLIKEAPEWIKDTLIFKLLVKDGSLKFVSKSNIIEAENEPFAGLNAEGKAVVKEEPEKEAEKEVKEEVQEEPVEETVVPKRKTTRKKKDDA